MNEEVLEIVSRIHKTFKEKRLTLSVAESCTGGLICHYITQLQGASDFFQAGVITYSIESKKTILDISPSTISTHGVVSEETAREMAKKIRALTNTDYSLSTSGTLGPAALEDKEVGLVYIAVSKEEQTFSKGMKFIWNREENKEYATLSALRLLIEVEDLMG